MPSLDPILIFTRAFEALKLRYMVSGSVAAIYYGEPRLTNDRGHFNLIHHETGFKADIYTGGRDELHAWGIENTILAKIGDDDLRLAPPEYVIIRKLQFYREGGSSKHLRDILAMVKGLGPDWDRGELDALIASHGLQSAWREALQCDA